jgi:hypothetical protein
MSQPTAVPDSSTTPSANTVMTRSQSRAIAQAPTSTHTTNQSATGLVLTSIDSSRLTRSRARASGVPAEEKNGKRSRKERGFKATIADFDARQSSNPYDFLSARFITNFYYDLLSEHGDRYHPKANKFLLTCPIEGGKWDADDAGELDLEREKWLEHAKPQHNILLATLTAVANLQGWDYWEAYKALESSKDTVYRHGLPASWKKGAKPKGKADIGTIVGDSFDSTLTNRLTFLRT